METTRRRSRFNPNGLVSRFGDNRRISRLLKSPEGEVIRRRVKRGAKWLAEREPNWAALIVDATDRGRFDLHDCHRCAVGTVLGNYSDHCGEDGYGSVPLPRSEIRWGMWHEAARWGEHLGFNLDDVPDGLDFRTYWAATEQAWVDYAREKAGR